MFMPHAKFGVTWIQLVKWVAITSSSRGDRNVNGSMLP